MKLKSNHGHARRERVRAWTSLSWALDTLSESQRLARAGDLAGAERAAHLAERHAKLAERLVNLKAALGRIADAHLQAQRALDASFREREAALKAREDNLYFAELALKHRAQPAPPLDPESERWKERLARITGEPSS